ncbi:MULTISPECIES: hypothetical protein [Pseudomonas]|uniref:Uncharacterized protein n=1 Tax=Pseudomonas sp. Hg7Tf TaxID=3236988 RepID=A0AB39HZZ8_9PSED|nr:MULTISPECIES: hypothetical protein [Pseudomonas]MDD1976443.1 hypothetical protein [Pseudomonas putida]QYX46759.1 hypothetical protein K3F43_18960 [Pseudomonas sp. S11A 273]
MKYDPLEPPKYNYLKTVGSQFRVEPSDTNTSIDEKLLYANTGSYYVSQDRNPESEGFVVLRVIEPISMSEAQITIRLDSGYETYATVNRTTAYMTCDHLDLILDNGNYATIDAKVVYYPEGSNNLSVDLHLVPIPPCAAEEGTEADFALFMSRGSHPLIDGQFDRILNRTLRVHELDEHATFTVNTEKGNTYYKTTTKHDAIAKAVPGDFFADRAVDCLSYVLSKRNPLGLSIPEILDTPLDLERRK